MQGNVQTWLPENHQAEQQVLMGLMSDFNSFESYTLTPEDFYTSAHKALYIEIYSFAEKGLHIDFPTMFLHVMGDENLNRSIDSSYMLEIKDSSPSSANFQHFYNLIRDLTCKRNLITALNIALQTSGNPKLTFNELMPQIVGMMDALEDKSSGIGDEFYKTREYVIESVNDFIREAENKKPGEMFGFQTGFNSLDNIIAPVGILPGSLVVVGALPKMGKTAFLTQWAINYIRDLNKPVLMFSLEVSSEHMGLRLLSGASRVSSSEILRPGVVMDPITEGIVKDGQNDLENNAQWSIVDKPAIRVIDIVRYARKFKKEHGNIGMITVDYLTLMKGEKAERNDLAFGEITKRLKNLARELDCIVLLMTQLNRGVANRSDRRPLPSDSRDTGQIEQDCDMWIGLHRDYPFNQQQLEDVPGRNLTEVIIRSNRVGDIGTAYMMINDGNFTDMSQEEGKVMASKIDDILKGKSSIGNQKVKAFAATISGKKHF